MIGDGVGITSGLSFVIATDSALADPAKNKLVLDFIQRLNKAQLWANTHQAEWAQKYADVTGLPASLTTAIVQRQHYTPVPIDATVYKWQQNQADAYHQLGLIPKLDVSPEFDTEFNSALFGGTK